LGCVREAVDGALLSFDYLHVFHERVANLADGTVELFVVEPEISRARPEMVRGPFALRRNAVRGVYRNSAAAISFESSCSGLGDAGVE